MSGRCRKGQILRSGYMRGRTLVKPACIKDLGKKGKTKKSEKVLPKLQPGKLSGHGYSLDKKAELRRRALMRASRDPKKGVVTHDKMLKTLRRVVVLKNYTKKSQPQNAKKYSADAKWMQKEYKKASKVL